jgi:hypothetical protein
MSASVKGVMMMVVMGMGVLVMGVSVVVGVVMEVLETGVLIIEELMAVGFAKRRLVATAESRIGGRGLDIGI